MRFCTVINNNNNPWKFYVHLIDFMSHKCWKIGCVNCIVIYSTINRLIHNNYTRTYTISIFLNLRIIKFYLVFTTTPHLPFLSWFTGPSLREFRATASLCHCYLIIRMWIRTTRWFNSFSVQSWHTSQMRMIVSECPSRNWYMIWSGCNQFNNMSCSVWSLSTLHLLEIWDLNLELHAMS